MSTRPYRPPSSPSAAASSGRTRSFSAPDLFLLLAVLFGDAVLSYRTENRLTLKHLTAALFGGAVIPYFLTSVATLRFFENGRYFVLIPFIIAFITDGGAYFTGVFFGKHHPFPHVSPKKTPRAVSGAS